MSKHKPSDLTRLPSGKLYRELRGELLRRKSKRAPATVHHSNANQNLQWEERQAQAFAVPFGRQIFQVQLILERHSVSGTERVVMFGRRLEPPSTTLSQNTQRATFNSSNLSPGGFYVRPQLLKKRPEIPRALATILAANGQLPFWADRHIHLGTGPAGSLIQNFLKATAILEEVKGMDASDLAQCYPAQPAFTVREIKSIEMFNEGGVRRLNRTARQRSAKLRDLAVEHYRGLSADGVLRCAVDGWSPSIPVAGAIVELHHDQTIQDAPEDGRKVSFKEALTYLFPLCPNCHRMLHSKPGGGRYTVAELKRLLKKRGGR